MLAELPRMAKSRKTDEGDRTAKTRHVRVYGDIAEMIGDILDVEGPEVTSASILDPLIRPQLTARHAAIAKDAAAMKSIRARRQKGAGPG